MEKVNGGSANKLPILLFVKKIDHRWVIDDIKVDDGENDSIVYKNTDYGFSFSLPKSWEGYKVVMDHWKGDNLNSGGTVETGQFLLIRHPKWRAKNPRQDIPIMIFPHDQWNSLQQEKFHIGAAPMGPSELARNNKFVFALPARYNYAFPIGYEEVEQILEGHALHPIDLD